jgi:glyoxalase superfamily protein
MIDVRFREVVIDCADPPALAKWWSEFTGYAPRTTNDDWSTIESDDGSTYCVAIASRVRMSACAC